MNQLRYYVSRKNVTTWLAVLLSIAAVVFFALGLAYGEDAVISTVNFWFQKVLPMAASLLFALLVLICGPKTFYRTSTAVFLGCVYFAQVALDQHLNGGYAIFAYKRYVAVCWILYLAFYIVYRMAITGKIKRLWLMQCVMAIPAVVLVYDCVISFDEASSWLFFDKIANCCMVTGLLMASLAMRPFRDGKYHRTWGDRADGRRLRTLDGMAVVGNYFMPNRNGASNSIHDTIEITNIERYIRKKRSEGLENFGLTHVILAAYVRSVAKYPGLNRYLSGQRVYQRDDDMQFTMTMKKDMRTDGAETTIKLHLHRADTAKEVYEKYNKEYEIVKSTPLDSGFDQIVGVLANIPGLILKFVIWFLKLLDYFGKVPNALLEFSPFHASVIFTSMGSLGIPPIVHHLYDFGNIPLFLAFGRKYRKNELDDEGNVVTRRYVDYTLNCDERTVDGFYYATVMKYFRKILRNPEVLDQPPEELVYDID